MRYFILCSIAFLFYYLYSITGLRTRYILWHLERRRYASGFVPLETLASATYHTMVICLFTESLLPVFVPGSPALLDYEWLQALGFRVKNIFFLSILQHSLLELSGFWDKIRREYFEIERY